MHQYWFSVSVVQLTGECKTAEQVKTLCVMTYYISPKDKYEL